MMSENDKNISYESLVLNHQQGSRKALKLLIKRFQPTLSATIRYYTNSGTPVQDLSQECWIDIIQKLSKLNLKISFRAWALTIARRRSIDWIREQQRMRKKSQALEQEPEEYEINENKYTYDSQKKVQDGILLLPASQQIVLRMFYLENLTLQEVSQVLDVPEGTIKSRLFHARENLKNIISTQK